MHRGFESLVTPWARVARASLLAAALMAMAAMAAAAETAATAAMPASTVAEPPAGAASCSGCHATSAKANSPAPRLIGRDRQSIVDAMAAFRSGQRSATVMDRIAKGFTDDETQAIAAWLATHK